MLDITVRGVVVGWLITSHTQVYENDICTIYIHMILCKLVMNCSNAMFSLSMLTLIYKTSYLLYI